MIGARARLSSMRWIVGGLAVSLLAVLVVCVLRFGGYEELQHAYWRRPQAEMIRTRLDEVVLPPGRPFGVASEGIDFREDTRGVQLFWLEGDDTGTTLRSKWNGAHEVSSLARVEMPSDGYSASTPFHSATDLYFVIGARGRGDTAVFRLPLGGGNAERILLAGRTADDFVVNDTHLFWTELADGETELRTWPLRGGSTEVVQRVAGEVDVTLSARGDAIAMLVTPGELAPGGGLQIWLGEGGAPLRQMYTSAHERAEIQLGDHYLFATTSEYHLETPRPAPLLAIARRGGGTRTLATLGARSDLVVFGDRVVVATQEHHDDKNWVDDTPRSWMVMVYDADTGAASELVRTDVRWLGVGKPTGGDSVLLRLSPGGGADQRLQLLAAGW